MKLTVEINNKSGERVKNDFFADIIKKTLKLSGFKFLEKKNVSVSIALVDEKEIKKLNRIYRKKDTVTDILSFAEYKNIEAIRKNKEATIFLGELVVCYNDIRKFAEKNKIDPKKELAEVISHGALHLLGMKHDRIMFAIQNKINE
ncbi:MAG: rRNA maturation RNase YbeY [Parcubacteria group bacterium]|jgi:probable rRNA maturation factor